MTLVLALTAGLLFGVAIYLFLSRETMRVAMGFIIFSNAANLIILGSVGWQPNTLPPLIVESGLGPLADPLPQAFVLTAIVIGFGASALLLAFIVRERREDTPRLPPGREPK